MYNITGAFLPQFTPFNAGCLCSDEVCVTIKPSFSSVLGTLTTIRAVGIATVTARTQTVAVGIGTVQTRTQTVTVGIATVKTRTATVAEGNSTVKGEIIKLHQTGRAAPFGYKFATKTCQEFRNMTG